MLPKKTKEKFTSFAELKNKADEGDPDAQYKIGVAYHKGRGVHSVMGDAIKYYRASAKQGHKEAGYALYSICELGSELISLRDPDALSWYKVAVEWGRHSALLQLAKIYEIRYETHKTPENEQLAVKHFLQLAEQHDEAKIALFRLCEVNADGLSLRDSRAPAWYLAAARSGNKNAQFSYGVMCEQVRKMPQAIEWYKKAAEQSHVQAYESLVRLSKDAPEAKKALLMVRWPNQVAQLVNHYRLVLQAQQGDAAAKKKVAESRGVLEDESVQTSYWSLSGAEDAYKLLSADDLARAQNYPKTALVGKGKFGEVYAIQLVEKEGKDASKTLAMKVVSLPAGSERSVIMKELTVFKRVQSPGIIGFYGSFEQQLNLHLLLELALCSLAQIISHIPASYALQLLSEIVRCLGTLHAHGIIHRDLKPDNILIGQDLHARLSDFGVAKVHQTLGHTTQIDDTHTGVVGTIQYIAPEIFGDESPTTAADMYAFGLTAWSLAKRAPLYSDKNPAQVMKLRLSENENEILKAGLPDNTLPFFSTIIDRSCAKVPGERWTAQKAYQDLQTEIPKHPVSDNDIQQIAEIGRASIPESQQVFYPKYF